MLDEVDYYEDVEDVADFEEVFDEVKHSGFDVRRWDDGSMKEVKEEQEKNWCDKYTENTLSNGDIEVSRKVVRENPFAFMRYVRKQYTANIVEEMSGFVNEEDVREQADVNLVSEVNSTAVQNIKGRDVGDVVTIEGQINSLGKSREYKHAVWVKCDSCGVKGVIRQDRLGNDLEYPDECSECDGSYMIVGFETSQRREAMIQDIYSNSDFSDPDEVRVILDDYFANSVKSGERVRMNAVVLRVDEMERNSELVLYCVGVKKDEETEVDISENEKGEFESVADREDMLNYLRSSVAPSLVGVEYQDIREAVLLQMCCGDFENMEDTRDTSHIMLAGDPSSGKSEVLEWVNEVSPVSSYSSGRNSSGVGLTAAVTHEESFDVGEWTISAGSIPKASGGVCCIDELDKMSNSDQMALNNPLSQQYVKVDKSSISAKLKAKTNCLMACNPDEGRINDALPIPQQLDFQTSLFPRFDLIYILQDEVSENEEEKLRELVSRKTDGTDAVDKDRITKFVKYARDEYNPEVTEEAQEAVVECMSELRQKDEGEGIQVTYRYADALLRLSKSHARLQLEEEVDKEDVNVAFEMIEESLSQLGVIHGNVDIDLLETGIGETERDILKKVEESNSYSEFVAMLDTDVDALRDRLEDLQLQGKVLIDEEEDVVRRI